MRKVKLPDEDCRVTHQHQRSLQKSLSTTCLWSREEGAINMRDELVGTQWTGSEGCRSSEKRSGTKVDVEGNLSNVGVP